MKLKKVLADREVKGVLTIEKTESLRNAAKKMTLQGASALMVRDGEKFVGILTKEDLVRSMSMDNVDPVSVPVSQFMTSRMIVASEEDDVEYVMNVMLRHKIGHLPVIVGKTIGGIITKDDILQVLNVEREIRLQWMSDYTGICIGNTVY